MVEGGGIVGIVNTHSDHRENITKKIKGGYKVIFWTDRPYEDLLSVGTSVT